MAYNTKFDIAYNVFVSGFFPLCCSWLEKGYSILYAIHYTQLKDEGLLYNVNRKEIIISLVS